MHQFQTALRGETTFPLRLHPVGSLPRLHRPAPSPAVPSPVPAPDMIGPIARVVDRLVTSLSDGRAADGDLRRLEDQLVLLISAIERHPGIEAAAVDLLAAACAIARADRTHPGRTRDARLARLLRDAAGRLVQRLDSARPCAAILPHAEAA